MHSVTAKRLEQALERLIGDETLRHDFFATPSDACATAGISLTWSEVGALLALPPVYFDEFAKGLPSHAPMSLWQQDTRSPLPSH